MWGCRKTHLVIFNFFSECRLFLTLFYLRNCDRIEVVFLHLLNDFVFDLKSVLHSTHVGCGWYPSYCDKIGCSVPRNLADCGFALFQNLPIFLIYPVFMSYILLLCLIYIIPFKCVECCEGKRRDHEIDTVQTIEAQYVGVVPVVNVDAEAQYVGLVPVVNVDAEAYDGGEIGEISEVNTNAEAHYLGDVLEVIADPDYSLQSSFVSPAVVELEAYNV